MNNQSQANTHLDEDIVALLSEAEQIKLKGHFEQAIVILQQILLIDPKCSEAYEEIGDNYISLRQLKKARKALEQAIKSNSTSANVYYLLGFLCSLENRWLESVQNLEKADRLTPNHPEILRCLGWAFYSSNRVSQGISVLERSYNLSPQDVNILCDLGVCYMSSRQFAKAKHTFERAGRLDPNSTQVKECLRMLKSMTQEQ